MGQNLAIVDAGKHDVADGQMRFVFLAFFDGAVGGIEIPAFGETLGGLAFEISIRHGVSDHGDGKTAVLQ